MTFLCEYNVNTANPWKHEITKLKKGEEIIETHVTELKRKSVTEKIQTLTNNEFDIKIKNSNQIQKDHISSQVTEIQSKVEGEDNSIEVIANEESSVIINKKDLFRKTEKIVSDDTSWSIFEMLKNVIKMPFRKSWNQ